MSYLSEQKIIARTRRVEELPHAGILHNQSYDAGFADGAREALLAYGIWKKGTQVIGCQDTPVKEIISKEFPEERQWDEKKN